MVRKTVLNGQDFGSARGMAFGSRLAIYKALWCGGDGVQSDVAKAMETAVGDGVDVLSLSIGTLKLLPKVCPPILALVSG